MSVLKEVFFNLETIARAKFIASVPVTLIAQGIIKFKLIYTSLKYFPPMQCNRG